MQLVHELCLFLYWVESSFFHSQISPYVYHFWINKSCGKYLRNTDGRPANNGVSRYPSYQKIFWLTEDFNWDYRYFVKNNSLVGQIWLICCENGFVGHLFCPKILTYNVSWYISIFYNITEHFLSLPKKGKLIVPFHFNFFF